MKANGTLTKLGSQRPAAHQIHDRLDGPRHLDVFQQKGGYPASDGVRACVSKCYTSHGWIDDAVLALPMVALFRMSKVDVLAS
jgi:hypothetical protein